MEPHKITVDRKVMKDLFSSFGLKGKRCDDCYRKVTPNNIAVISKDAVYCNRFTCLLAVEKLFPKLSTSQKLASEKTIRHIQTSVDPTMIPEEEI